MGDITYMDNLLKVWKDDIIWFKFDIFKKMYRPGTSISKAKVKSSATEDGGFNKVQADKMPTLQDYIKKRDWIGAVALL